MRIRSSYVSNSSSSSFVLKSTSDMDRLKSENGLRSVNFYNVQQLWATCLDLTIKYFSLSELEYGVYLGQIENDGLMPSFIIDSFFRHNFNLGDIIECFFNKNLQKHHYITDEIDRDDWAEYYSHLNFELFDCDL